MADTCALEGIDITKSFGGFSALKDVGIRVPAGEIRGVIGPNGAGKSTLMDVLSGRARHWTGNVRMFGRDISASSVQQRRRAGLARSFQRTNIFPHLTVVDQLKIAARAAQLPNVDEIMAELTLTALAYKRAADISYGDQRRLDLALALIGRPKILLLDEPAAGLSIKESLDLAHTLKDLAARWGVTVLLVEHDMDVVFSICDRITVLHLGTVLAEGSAEEIRNIPAVITAYLGSAT
jgi:branched-chain amino acid transport system ATP-binding protein